MSEQKTPEELQLLRNKFQDDYQMFFGLDEYFKWKGEEMFERWTVLKKALLHQNWYRIRDVLVRLQYMPNSNDTHIKSWTNTLLREHLDVEVKPQMVFTLIRKWMSDDKLMTRACRFMNYFAEKAEHAGAAIVHIPDLNDFLSKGQIRSKLWLIEELKNIIGDKPMGNVMFYGGWYNFVAHFLFENDVNKIYSIDMENNVHNPCKRLYTEEVEQDRFFTKNINVNLIKWKDDFLATFPASQWPKDLDTCEYYDIDKIDILINTSCEHMDNTWFENLPDGTFVVLQQNDYFDNEQHINCCNNLQEVKNKYPMREILYEGELDTHLYNRFMLIGRK